MLSRRSRRHLRQSPFRPWRGRGSTHIHTAFMGLTSSAGSTVACNLQARASSRPILSQPRFLAGSGNKQATVKLCCVEIGEVAVAFGPPAGCEVITQAAHGPLLDVRTDSRPDRHSAADMLVEVE